MSSGDKCSEEKQSRVWSWRATGVLSEFKVNCNKKLVQKGHFRQSAVVNVKRFNSI